MHNTLRNMFEFVTNDTHDEMNRCDCGVSIIEKDSEDRLVRAFPGTSCLLHNSKELLLPQVVLDGTFSRGRRGGTSLTACMQDGNTETIVVSIAFVPFDAKESTGHGFATTSSKPCHWTGKQSHSYQTEEQDLYLH